MANKRIYVRYKSNEGKEFFVPVEAEIWGDYFAVHPVLNADFEPVAGTWCVTHAPTGSSIGGRTWVRDLAVAHALALRKIAGVDWSSNDPKILASEASRLSLTEANTRYNAINEIIDDIVLRFGKGTSE